MGGNAQIFDRAKGKIVQADQIPLKEIGRGNFINKFSKTFKKLNSMFKKKYGYPIWKNEKNLDSGLQFNGSTSYIFNTNIEDYEIEKYKSHAGDLDLVVPKEFKQQLWDFLKPLENTEIIPGVVYMGPSTDKLTFSAIGETLIVLFKADFNGKEIIAQVDFELLDVDEHGNPSEWASFSHSSSFEDQKQGIKAVFHKYLIQSIIGAASLRDDIVIATPTSTPDKLKLSSAKADQLPRMLKFSVVRGVRFAYEPMYDENGEKIFVDGKQVYKKLPSKTSNYETIVKEIYKLAFGRIEDNPKDVELFSSFVGIIELMKKYLSKKEIKGTFERFEQKLFGKFEQALDQHDPQGDFQMKNPAYERLIKEFGFKRNEKMINDYYSSFKIKESIIRNVIREVNNEFN